MEYQVVINGIEVKACFTQENVEEIFVPLLRRLHRMQQEKDRRILVMLSAPPGAGKTTLCSFLQWLSQSREDLPALTSIGMDGFHQRQEVLLEQTVLRDGKQIPMVQIKGAPVTFDLGALLRRVARVAAGESCPWPEYNRLLHNPEEKGLRVCGDIILLEGNYLLLEEEGWRELRRFADLTLRIVAEERMLRERLVRRKMDSGASRAEAERFVDFSDLVNAREVLTHSASADIELEMLEDGSYCLVRGNLEI
jgi:hypothetical protein